MNKLSILEKLKIFLEVSKSSVWFIVAAIILVMIGIIYIKTNKTNRKRNKMIYIIFSLLVASVIIIIYHSSLNKMFDYMINNLFVVIYFPNLAFYFTAIITMNIILWISLFHFKSSNAIRKVNVIVYLIMNYLLLLILSEIEKNKLDIFSQESIYSNKQVTALIELSSLLFFIWIIFLIIYRIILFYVRKDYRPKVKRVFVKKPVKMLPENYNPISVPNYAYGKIASAALEREKQLTSEYEKYLTLDDYRLLLRMLKEQKEKETNKTKEIVEEEKKFLLQQKQIQKAKEEQMEFLKKQQEQSRLEQIRIKEMKEQEELREQQKFTELELLYRGIK